MVKPNKKQPKGSRKPKRVRVINHDCAGIDVGADEVYVAVEPSRSESPVRRFGTTTPDLREMTSWLTELGITSVAMESTGVYWMPVYALLEEAKIETHLVDARRLHTAPGRKTDVCDAQWIQELHSYGLLSKVVILPDENRRLRCLLRLRESHVRSQGQAIQRMQKALTEMNIRLDRVLTDITGRTGMLILRAILDGKTSPEDLIKFRHGNCKHPPEQFVKALTGYYTDEHLFALSQHLQVYDTFNELLEDCEKQITTLVSSMKVKELAGAPTDPFDKFIPKDDEHTGEVNNTLQARLHSMFGVDLTKIPGIGVQTALTLVAEVGTDLTRWRSSKAFASWLGLCPHPKISGGKILSTKSKRSDNRAARALRMAASSLYRSDTFVGAFHARMKFRKHKAAAVTSTAHMLARIIWNCVIEHSEYQEQGSEAFSQKQEERKRKKCISLAKELGFELQVA